MVKFFIVLAKLLPAHKNGVYFFSLETALFLQGVFMVS